ncbi:MAG: dihydropteroate synthase [Chloroflexota bacterium]
MQLQLRGHTIDCTNRTVVMGIVNVSHDSPITHSIHEPNDAHDYALELVRRGAAIIDVGAHSTSTGARDMTAQEEIERVCPVIAALAAEGIPSSVDTWTPAVARAAAKAGVGILNDVTGVTDPEMVAVVGEFHLPAIVMHMRGRPKHHHEVDQHFVDIGAEVQLFMLERAAVLEAAGAGQVWFDPGFGFGKSAQDNLRLIQALPALVSTGYPVLISASRKGFLGELLGRGDRQDVDGLLEATVAFNTIAATNGVHVARVHDVAELADALAIVNAMRARTD